MAKPTPPRAGKSPAFQFYPADFLADEQVAMMSLAERGAYITLLAYSWREGSIPAAEPDLARLLRCTTLVLRQLWGRVGTCFVPHPTTPLRLINPRQETDRCAWAARAQERQRAGVQGGRKSAQLRATFQAELEQGSTSASASANAPASASKQPPSTHTPSVAKPPGAAGGGRVCVPDPPGFAEFWSLYPRKEGKGAARKVWARLAPGPDLVASILGAVECQRDWPQWRKDGGQYVPHPATWLHQERWADEGGLLRGMADEERQLIPSGAMTVGEWNRIKASLRKPIPPVFGWGDGDE